VNQGFASHGIEGTVEMLFAGAPSISLRLMDKIDKDSVFGISHAHNAGLLEEDGRILGKDGLLPWVVWPVA